MITIGFTSNEYEMIAELIDSHMENMINGPVDEHIIGVVNEWIGVLHTLGEHELAEEYESALDDIQEVA